MEKDQKLAIFGTGGFSREILCLVVDLWSQTGIDFRQKACFVEQDKIWEEKFINDIPVIPESRFDPEKYLAIIGTGDPGVRRRIAEQLPKSTRFATVIHPGAVVSQWAEIGEGSVICAGTIITCNLKIGKHAHLNLHTTVGHDCNIGDYFTSAPAANISGICTFGDNVYLGTNCSIRQGVSICSDVTIGMGAVVVKNITEPGVYVGNPLTKLR